MWAKVVLQQKHCCAVKRTPGKSKKARNTEAVKGKTLEKMVPAINDAEETNEFRTQ